MVYGIYPLGARISQPKNQRRKPNPAFANSVLACFFFLCEVEGSRFMLKECSLPGRVMAWITLKKHLVYCMNNPTRSQSLVEIKRCTYCHSGPSLDLSRYWWVSRGISGPPEYSMIIRLHSMRRNSALEAGLRSRGFCDHKTIGYTRRIFLEAWSPFTRDLETTRLQGMRGVVWP